MLKRILKVTGFLFVLISIVTLSSCKSKQKDHTGNETGFEKSMTNQDTIEVKRLVDMFFQYAEHGKTADAAAMLYKDSVEDEYSEPQLLDNEEMKKVKDLLNSLPIKSHSIDYIKFSETYANEVKCTTLIEPAHGKMPEIKTVFYFKPINYLGNWRLCLLNSRNGDEPVIDNNKKDSVSKEYSNQMREKKLKNQHK